MGGVFKWGKGLGSHLYLKKISSWVPSEGLWVREKGGPEGGIWGLRQNVRGAGAWPWAVQVEMERSGWDRGVL